MPFPSADVVLVGMSPGREDNNLLSFLVWWGSLGKKESLQEQPYTVNKNINTGQKTDHPTCSYGDTCSVTAEICDKSQLAQQLCVGILRMHACQ